MFMHTCAEREREMVLGVCDLRLQADGIGRISSVKSSHGRAPTVGEEGGIVLACNQHEQQLVHLA
jgi:hypothetical protein